MAKLSHLLSDLQIKRWIAKGASVAKSDGDGLTFTLSKGGTASWVLRYRQGAGTRKEITIGNYPDVSLAAAREEARALRAAVDKGADPALQKQERKSRAAAAWTISDLVADYREKVLLPSVFATGTIYYRNADIDQLIVPKLGARRVDQVTSMDIVTMLKDSKRSWAMTKRALTTASKLYDHACGLTIVPANPCTGIKLTALKGPRPTVRKRVMLEADELKALLSGIDFIGRENALAFRILLVTCVRGVELVKAKKTDVDLEAGTWWVPDDSVKTRVGFSVPLPTVVADWFRELIAVAGDSQWVLPARRMDRVRNLGDVPVGRTTLWAAFNRAFERGDIDIRRFTPHDTRSTAKGHLRNLGVSREISEIALNHKLKGMEGIYDVREEIPERRQALAIWADYVVACETGQPPPSPENVFPLKRAA
ncbi:integrase arm-type DNA-binding domain-containing protein [Variovorax sp. J22G73]|uniref:tyrosine-type recombinase/integrase n=1 Tax=unclassified Variovorax TaxID=663243 RepID=UPI002577400D|nr:MULTISPECIES: site-specific integrase [unclassified Variovorax]MDM0003878.1 integrase arm-type DNA-binding domain-containing protein [Variovorax sp. J22R203]MDM0096456.1 integrase arm-type DNA-binding domain-containing protein [Variovorax sp. J22G73]